MIPFFLCFNLWFSEHLFPVIPVLDTILIPNKIGDIVLITSFVILFFLFVFRPNWKIVSGIVIIYVYWIFVDQNRIQPFYFEIIFIVFALGHFKDSPKQMKRCVLFILIGTYFWSGVHKINPVFFDKWLNGLNKRIPFIPFWMRQGITYAVPFLELIFGLFLIFTRTRKLGIWLLALMHAMILTTFTFANTGYIVFALNIFNVFLLFYLFYNTSFSVKEVFHLNHPKAVLFFMIGIVLPVLNLFGFYDHILSFSYFSGKPKYARLYFSEGSNLNRLPNHIYNNIRTYNGKYYIDYNEWAANTIGVMVYSEIRVYEKIKKHIDSYYDMPNTEIEFY